MAQHIQAYATSIMYMQTVKANQVAKFELKSVHFNKSWGLEVVDVRDTLPSKCMNK